MEIVTQGWYRDDVLKFHANSLYANIYLDSQFAGTNKSCLSRVKYIVRVLMKKATTNSGHGWWALGIVRGAYGPSWAFIPAGETEGAYGLQARLTLFLLRRLGNLLFCL